MVTSSLWMSTERGSDNRVTSNSGVDNGGSSAGHPARAMFLGQMLPLLRDFAGVALTGVALALGLLFVKQDNLLYIPEIEGMSRHNGSNPPGYQSPAEYYVPFETHMIETSNNNSIHSWLLLHSRSKEENLPTIMFLHGNAG